MRISDSRYWASFLSAGPEEIEKTIFLSFSSPSYNPIRTKKSRASQRNEQGDRKKKKPQINKKPMTPFLLAS
jgi:hypothetical protein